MSGTEVERGEKKGWTTGAEGVDSVGSGMLAAESLTSEDDLQCELMRFVEGACTCSCVLYELENGEN